jgi:ribonuclease-3
LTRAQSGGDSLAALEVRLGYSFVEPALLREALTHASRRGGAAKSGTGTAEPVNERLEFLGDRVLGLVIAEALLQNYPDAREGELAPRLNALVRKETLAQIGEDLGLVDAIRLAKGDTLSGGAARMAILADACEAILGAIYLDTGFESARTVILKSWGERLATLREVPRDAKTALQEWAQARGLPTPVYELVLREGPDHAPKFRIAARVEGLGREEGEGTSKRAAEQAAAAALLAQEKL